jgi:hypothetical protein
MGNYGCGSITKDGVRVAVICELNNCVIGGTLFHFSNLETKNKKT